MTAATDMLSFASAVAMAALSTQSSVSPAISSSVSCPANTTLMGSTSDGLWLVCEQPLAANQYGELVPAGRLEFHAASGNGTVRTFAKTSEAMFGCNGLRFNQTAGCAEPPALANGSDPIAERWMNQQPAMVYDGGFDMYDPAHGGRRAQVLPDTGWNAHTFVGSRSASQDAVFDSYAGDVNSVGYPTMTPFLGKYMRSTATYKDAMNRLEQREGLWGGWLPVVSFHFKIAAAAPTPRGCSNTPQPCPSQRGRTWCPNVGKRQCDSAPAPCPPCPHTAPPAAPPPPWHPPPSPSPSPSPQASARPPVPQARSSNASGGWVEWTACPVPDMQGNFVQDVLFRIIKFDAKGGVIDARYIDTYAYRSMDGVVGDAGVPGMGHPAGSSVAARFYQTLIDQKVFWDATFALEGTIKWQLPDTIQPEIRPPRSQPVAVASPASGASLANRVWHSIVRDMIIRANVWFPKYGVAPNGYGGTGNNNCDLTLTQSLLLALHTGSFDWARGVLENFFRFDQRPDGPRYRGPSMISNGQHLSEIALYNSYTGDPTNIIGRYHLAILGLVNQFRAVRAKALRLSPSNVAYGMPTGNTIDDLYGTSVECGTTHPDGKGGPGGDCETRLPAFDIAFKMIQAFRDLGGTWVRMGAAPRPGQPANLTAEGQLLLQEAEALRNDTLAAFRRGVVRSENKYVNGRNVSCHPCHAGWISCKRSGDVTGKGYTRPSADVMCGAIQASQEAYGALPVADFRDIFDYSGGVSNDVPGNLRDDKVPEALAAFYTQASAIMTRGTWTGAEVPGSGATAGTGVSTVTSSGWATWLTALFVFDQAEPDTFPFQRTLWFGKGIPREWLAPGESVSATGVPTRYGGRVTLAINTTVADHYTVNITLPAAFAWPELGLKLRIRSPGFQAGRRISTALVGGTPWPARLINASEETLSFPRAGATTLAALQRIEVTLA